jgi:hypothetical protein
MFHPSIKLPLWVIVLLFPAIALQSQTLDILPIREKIVYCGRPNELVATQPIDTTQIRATAGHLQVKGQQFIWSGLDTCYGYAYLIIDQQDSISFRVKRPSLPDVEEVPYLNHSTLAEYLHRFEGLRTFADFNIYDYELLIYHPDWAWPLWFRNRGGRLNAVLQDFLRTHDPQQLHLEIWNVRLKNQQTQLIEESNYRSRFSGKFFTHHSPRIDLHYGVPYLEWLYPNEANLGWIINREKEGYREIWNNHQQQIVARYTRTTSDQVMYTHFINGLKSQEGICRPIKEQGLQLQFDPYTYEESYTTPVSFVKEGRWTEFDQQGNAIRYWHFEEGVLVKLEAL